MRELTGKPIGRRPSFQEPEARLALMDEQGIQCTLMFPTLASLIEERLIDDPELTQVALRAFNEWLHDQWTFDYQGRIFATPIVNPVHPGPGHRGARPDRSSVGPRRC